MQIVELLKKKIQSAEDLQSIVRTMKVLAAVGIRQFEQAVMSLEEYHQTLEFGFQILLRNSPQFMEPKRRKESNTCGLIILGSGQGLCGRFNDQILAFTRAQVGNMNEGRRHILAVGDYIAGDLEQIGWQTDCIISVPGSISGIQSTVSSLLIEIENWRVKQNVDSIYLFHNKMISGTGYDQYRQQLFPLDVGWLNSLREKSWHTNRLPYYTMEWDSLFKNLVQQYIFVSLYRAVAESLAAEHASRLNSMQAAEKKINEHLETMSIRLRDLRQTMITDEILDIMSGYEVAMSG